ncbi:MarR family transcriptional regulator [Acetobacteraceae bacterium B3987]|nr:MarR family transcriptional regulator [Acetobacteraceae bacterium B3987]
MDDPSDSSLSLKRQICFPFYEAANLLQQLYRPFLAPLNLTYAQYLVMLVLWGHDGKSDVTVGTIGRQLGFETGTLSPLLKRMEAAGHVKRMRSPDDERRVIISLTQQGQFLREKAKYIPDQLLRDSGLSDAELAGLREKGQTFAHCLRTMLQNRSV